MNVRLLIEGFCKKEMVIKVLKGYTIVKQAEFRKEKTAKTF